MTIGIGLRISVIEGSNRDLHSGWTLSGLQDVGHAGVVTGRDGLSLPSLISAFPQDKEGFVSDTSHAENRPLFSRSRHPPFQSLDRESQWIQYI